MCAPTWCGQPALSMTWGRRWPSSASGCSPSSWAPATISSGTSGAWSSPGRSFSPQRLKQRAEGYLDRNNQVMKCLVWQYSRYHTIPKAFFINQNTIWLLRTKHTRRAFDMAQHWLELKHLMCLYWSLCAFIPEIYGAFILNNHFFSQEQITLYSEQRISGWTAVTPLFTEWPPGLSFIFPLSNIWVGLGWTMAHYCI